MEDRLITTKEVGNYRIKNILRYRQRMSLRKLGYGSMFLMGI